MKLQRGLVALAVAAALGSSGSAMAAWVGAEGMLNVSNLVVLEAGTNNPVTALSVDGNVGSRT
jgi:hypothetical protein